MNRSKVQHDLGVFLSVLLKTELWFMYATFILRSYHLSYICYIKNTYEARSEKIGLMHVRKVSSQISLCFPQANHGRHFPLLWYISFKESLFLSKIQFRLKESSLIRMCGLHGLIWEDTLSTCIRHPFHKARIIS